MKARRMMKKAIKNNTGRMYELAESMVYKYKMVVQMSDSMQEACLNMKEVMGKQAEKRKKKLEKKNADAPQAQINNSNERVKKFIRDVKVKKGLADGEDVPASASTAPANGGIDDIVS